MNPADLYQYLLEQGASPIHALGVLANVRGESAFRPEAVGDAGASYGLFQYQGDRRKALHARYGDSPTWQQQVDFALSEPEGRAFLGASFETPEAATAAFVRDFERPQNPEADIARRIGFLPDLRLAATGQIAALPGNPRTGRADLPPPTPPRIPPMAETQPTLMDTLNPVLGLLMGVAMGRGNLAQRIGTTGQAMLSQQAAQDQLQELRMKRERTARQGQREDALSEWFRSMAQTPGMEAVGNLGMADPASGADLYTQVMALKQKGVVQEQNAAQYLAATGDEEGAALIRAGYAPKSQQQPTYGVSPNYIRRGDKVYAVRYGSNGQMIEEEVQGVPFAVEQRLPEFRGTVAEAEAGGRSRGATQEAARQGLETLGLLYNDIMDALPQATGSWLGAKRDELAGAIGISTKGSLAADKLRVLGARLVQTVPRMEGPQSDKDVAMYREAAGRIGDPTIPPQNKAAALETILNIAKRQQALGNPAFETLRLPESRQLESLRNAAGF